MFLTSNTAVAQDADLMGRAKADTAKLTEQFSLDADAQRSVFNAFKYRAEENGKLVDLASTMTPEQMQDKANIINNEFEYKLMNALGGENYEIYLQSLDEGER